MYNPHCRIRNPLEIAFHTSMQNPNHHVLLDAHAHLQDPILLSRADEVLWRARQAGVCRIVCNGSSQDDWPAVLELAGRSEAVIPAFGLHPWYVGGRSAAWMDDLQRCLDAVPSSVGEIGLDRWLEPRDESAQEEVFRLQLDVARQRDLPVTVHCLRAWGWLLDVLRDERPLPAGLILHAYGGAPDLLDELIRLNAYVSFACSVLHPNAKRARASLAAAPADRILLETDSPDLPPPDAFRATPHLINAEGKPANEPANLALSLPALAELRGTSPGELANLAWSNGERLFGRFWNA